MSMNDQQEQDLTRNPAAEREVIGSVIAAPAYAQQAMRLRAEDFTVGTHQVAWRAIAHLLDRNDSITVQAVCAACGNGIDGQGRRDIEQMVALAGATSGILSDAVAAVIDAARRRATAAAFHNGRRRAVGSDDPIDVIAARVAKEVDDAVAGRQTSFHDGREVNRRLRARLESPVKNVPTGIEKLDFVLGGGMAPANMLAIVAKTKTGKTTLAATISHNLLMREEPHLVISLERGETDIELLCAARTMGMSFQTLQRDYEEHKDRFGEYQDDARHRLRFYHHEPGATLEQVWQAILTAHRLGATGFILDHYQLVARPPRENSKEHLTRVAQTLANLCARLGMWSIVNAQSDIDGVPRDCDALTLAAADNYVLRRDPGNPEAWLECMGSSRTEGLDAGKAGSPCMLLDGGAGPHFRDA